MGKNKKNTLKKKSQIHLLMIGGLLLIAVIVLFAVLNITKDTKENIKDTEEDTKKSSSIIVSPNIVKLNPITCNNNESATIDLSWNPIVGFGEYYVVVETPDKKQLNVTVESTGTNKLDVDNLDDKITFDIPANQCNDTFYVKIEVTKDNQKEESLQKKIYFNITHQIPPEEECSVIPENGEIYYLEHLAYIDTNADTLSGSYTLLRDLDFLDSDSYCDNSNMQQWTEGEGWEPIGSQEAPFTGSLNGENKRIYHLYSNKSSNYVGLFGYVSNGSLNNLNLEDFSINGSNYVGGLIGYLDSGTVSDCLVNGYNEDGAQFVGGLVGALNNANISDSNSESIVSGGEAVGGLIGLTINSTILNSHSNSTVSGGLALGGLIGVLESGNVLNSTSNGSVDGQNNIGGLIGFLGYYSGTINNCISEVGVSGELNTGGLVGYFHLGAITDSVSSGEINGTQNAGGLVGHFNSGTITNSFSNSSISAQNFVGGLVGILYAGEISKSYSNSNINGSRFVGGLVGGTNSNDANINNCYSTGNLAKFDPYSLDLCEDFGGFIGNWKNGEISNSYSLGTVCESGTSQTEKGFSGLVNIENVIGINNYWNINTSLQFTSGGNEIGLTDSQMKNSDSFDGWDFETVWDIQEGVTYPYLRSNTQNPLPQ
jgi:hypothetical protein